MKQPWTRLKFTGKTEAEKSEQFNYSFLKHHQQASEIILDSSGTPMAAIYFTPQAINKQQTKAIFREIQRRTRFACEEDKE